MRLRLDREIDDESCFVGSTQDSHGPPSVKDGDLVATVSAEEDGSVVVRWMLGSEPDERWLTVAQAKRSVDESRIAIAWENTTPSEWRARETGLAQD